MLGSFFQRLISTLPLVPVIVAGVEQTQSASKGADKKQVAMNWIQLAAGITTAVAPEEKRIVDAVMQSISQTIDAIVAGANQTGEFHKTANYDNTTNETQFQPEPPAHPTYIKDKS
jgi:hypothetical protein